MPMMALTPQRPDGDGHSLSTSCTDLRDNTRCASIRNFALHVNIEGAWTNGLIWCDTAIDDLSIMCLQSRSLPLSTHSPTDSDSTASEYDNNMDDQSTFNLILLAFAKLQDRVRFLFECPSLKTFADFIRPFS